MCSFFVFTELFYRKVATVFYYANLEVGYFKRCLTIFEFGKCIYLDFKGIHPFISTFTFKIFVKYKVFLNMKFN